LFLELEQWARQVDFDVESVQTLLNNGFRFSFFEILIFLKIG